MRTWGVCISKSLHIHRHNCKFYLRLSVQIFSYWPEVHADKYTLDFKPFENFQSSSWQCLLVIVVLFNWTCWAWRGHYSSRCRQTKLTDGLICIVRLSNITIGQHSSRNQLFLKEKTSKQMLHHAYASQYYTHIPSQLIINSKTRSFLTSVRCCIQCFILAFHIHRHF